jgi:septal ring factor EnvC (AmiA/AmiB activator)
VQLQDQIHQQNEENMQFTDRLKDIEALLQDYDYKLKASEADREALKGEL